MLGCGSFLLTDEADNLRDYYEDGKEIVFWKDIPDLVKKIKYYLENDAIVEEHSNNARAHAYKNFSSDKLTQKMLALYNQAIRKTAEKNSKGASI